MARTARLIIPDVAVHVVQRAHDRADCFLSEADYEAYLATLWMHAARFGCAVHAYCLMTNHVHLLLTPRDSTGCAQLMKHVAQRYSWRMKAKTSRSGTLWEGRFFSALVPTENYALACYRYIELNPVRAALAAHAAAYRWSSYRANAGVRIDDFLIPHAAYLALATDNTRRAAAYAALCNTSLDRGLVENIRKATRGGYPIGATRRPRGRPKMVTVTV
jgi:putative transposase